MKIKKVEIQAFKSYVKMIDGTFDFSLNGDAADIVVIHAHNGFGKTSFYDAVDYCVTNNITRYIRSSSIRNSYKTTADSFGRKCREGDYFNTYILRSNKAPDDLDTIINIYTDSKVTPLIEKKHKRAKKGCKDYHFSDTDTDIDKKYFREVILNQESIDSYLREHRPEQRYADFLETQPKELIELDEKRKQISKMIAFTKDQINLDKDEQKNLKLEIVENVDGAAKAIGELNILMSEADILMTDIDEKYSNRLHQSNILKSNLIDSQLTLRLDDIQTKIEHSNEFNANLPNILTSISRIREARCKKSNEEKKLAEIKDSIFFQNMMAKLQTDKEYNIKKLDDISYLIEKFSSYEEVLKEKSELDNNLISHSKKIDELTYKIESNKNIVQHSNIELERTEIEITKLKEKISELPSYFSELNIIRNDITIISEKIDSLNYDEISEEKIITSNLIEYFNEWTFSDYKSLNNIDYNDEFYNLNQFILIKELSLELHQCKYTLKISESEIASLLKLDHLYNSRNDDVSKIIEISSKYLEKNKNESRCPLCAYDYSSREGLQSAISNNMLTDEHNLKISLSISELSHKIQCTRIRIGELEESITENLSYLMSFLSSKERALKSKIDKEHSILYNNKIRLASLLEKEVIIKNNVFNFSDKYKSESYINNLLKDIEESRKRICHSIESFKCKIKENEGLLKSLKNEFNINNSSKNNFSNVDFFLSYRDLASEIFNDVGLKNIDGIVKDDLINKKHKIVDLLSHINIEYEDATLKIKDLDYKTSCDIINYNTQIELVNSDINEANEIVRNELTYVNNISKSMDFVFYNAPLYEMESDEIVRKFHHNLSKLKRESSSIYKNIKLVKTFINTGEQYLIYLENISKKKRFNEIEERLGNLDKILGILSLDNQMIANKLKIVINSYFNTELVNLIYSKIDPHPDYKKVRFDCSFSESKKPTLDIYIYNDEGEKVVSPTLSFSSAQVNILSLSIFLARAIENSESKGRFNCIFIDDPIQSMDSINILAMIDLLRNIAFNLDKQIIISTHDQYLFKLLKVKLPSTRAKFINIESHGKVARAS